MDDLTPILAKLDDCVRNRSFVSLKADWLEIKPVPPTGGAWDSVRESICAFFNARGGAVIFGIKDEQKSTRHFTFTGYTEDNSEQVAKLRHAFQDDRRRPLDVADSLLLEVKTFQTGQIAVIRVSALPEDRKYCFYKGSAFERVLDRDEKIPAHRVHEQEERKREMETYRELRPVEGVTVADLSLQRINELVLLINQGQSSPIETIKDSVSNAIPFLEKKRFMLKDGQITTLGVLVCATWPEDHLLFRRQLDAFVDVPNVIAQDKKTFRDNIFQFMSSAHGWALRNIQTRVLPDAGGTAVDLTGGAEWHSDPSRMLSIRGPRNRPTFRLNRTYQQQNLI